jgi:hypothetical protein
MWPEVCKKVITSYKGKENGYLLELFKDGDKTPVYLTTIKPGGFKGYHLHKVRRSRYACIKGKIMVILDGERVLLREGQRMEIDTNVFIGLQNDWKEEAWLINYPDPAYDPKLTDEQVDKDEL